MTAGQLLCHLLLLFLLCSSMKRGKTFSQATIGSKSVTKPRNESDLENFATLLTLFILTP
jgi:hypothetical protein